MRSHPERTYNNPWPQGRCGSFLSITYWYHPHYPRNLSWMPSLGLSFVPGYIEKILSCLKLLIRRNHWESDILVGTYIPSDRWESRPPQAFYLVFLQIRSWFPFNKLLQDGHILLLEWIRAAIGEDLLLSCRTWDGSRLCNVVRNENKV